MIAPLTAPVVLFGALGVMGRMHTRVYNELGIDIIPIDPAIDRGLHKLDEPALFGPDTIVDICSPTSEHTHCMSMAYSRGARSFIVEKPAANSAQQWQQLLDTMPDARIFVVHNYLFSRAFQACDGRHPDLRDVTTHFDKDRLADDIRGRGANSQKGLPHLLQVEAPHQFALALALIPDLSIGSSEYLGAPASPSDPRFPTRAVVRLEGHGRRRAQVGTDLRAPNRRSLSIASTQRTTTIHFPIGDRMSRIVDTDAKGNTRLIYEEVDDMILYTLKAAVNGIAAENIPWYASPAFATQVLGLIDDARLMAPHASPLIGSTAGAAS